MKLLIFLTAVAAFMASTWALKNQICGLPHSRSGDGRISCEAYLPSWTYDAPNGACIKFIYGGCGGNDNRFNSKENCEKVCLE